MAMGADSWYAWYSTSSSFALLQRREARDFQGLDSLGQEAPRENGHGQIGVSRKLLRIDCRATEILPRQRKEVHAFVAEKVAEDGWPAQEKGDAVSDIKPTKHGYSWQPTKQGFTPDQNIIVHARLGSRPTCTRALIAAVRR